MQTEFRDTYSVDLFEVVHIDSYGASADDLNEFWDQFEHDFPILWGCDDLINSWGAGYVPHNTLLDACGTVLGNWIGWGENSAAPIHVLIQANINPSPLAVSDTDVFNDSDGDGVVEPGESASLDVLLSNECTEDCNDAGGLLVSELEWLTITQATATWPNSEPGDIYPGSIPFEILVAEDAPPVFDIELNLEVTIGDDSWSVPVLFSGGERHVYYIYEVAAEEPEWQIESAPGWEGQWHISQLDYNSPDQSWHCGDTGTAPYASHQDSRLISPPLELLPYSQLIIQHWMQAEVSSVYPDSAYDGSVVDISRDGGDSWSQLLPLVGYNKAFRWESGGGNPATHPFTGGTPCFSGQFDWREDAFNLTDFAGETVEFRFRFGSDGGGGDTGWFIDDIALTGYIEGAGVSQFPGTMPSSPRLDAAYPNPFNGVTCLEFTLPLAGGIRLVIHDALGRVVAVPLQGALPAGQHHCSFDAAGLATGIYFAVLQVEGRQVDRRKLLLVK